MVLVPTFHLNGTSREALLAPLVAASEALHAAMLALAQCYPNGRDYYPQGPGAIQVAVTEHMARISAVAAVRQEIIAIAESIV